MTSLHREDKMKVTTLLAGTLFACTALAQYNITSKPFHLRALSDDEDYNGVYFAACHTGAALESLCVLGKNVNDASEFHFNTSIYDTGFNKTLGKTGYLTWTLSANGGTLNFSEPLSLYFDPITNLALPIFEPGFDDATLMAFDPRDRLNIQGYIDDRVIPAKAGPTQAYYRWYICKTYYVGYRYTTLTWLVGEGPPQNPTCCKVDVERHFVDDM